MVKFAGLSTVIKFPKQVFNSFICCRLTDHFTMPFCSSHSLALQSAISLGHSKIVEEAPCFARLEPNYKHILSMHNWREPFACNIKHHSGSFFTVNIAIQHSPSHYKLFLLQKM